jgi:hypothetical protein
MKLALGLSHGNLVIQVALQAVMSQHSFMMLVILTQTDDGTDRSLRGILIDNRYLGEASRIIDEHEDNFVIARPSEASQP